MDNTTDEQFVSQIMGTQEEPEQAPLEATAPEVDEPVTEEAQAEPETEYDTDEAEPEPEQDTPAPKLFKVKVDGEEREVTEEELLRGYSGQSKIQKGMQEAAAMRKQAEQALQALQTEQQRVLQMAQAMQQQGLIPPPKAPDPKLSEKDPIAYTREFAKYQQAAQAYQAQQSNIAAIEARQQAANEAAMRAHLTAQAETLKERIPDFANPETAAKTRAKLIEAGTKHYGYSEQELMGVTDARAVQVLNDAAKWRELQARTADGKKTPEAPRTVKPGAKRPEPPQLAQQKLIQTARKTQNPDDWIKFLTT